jgi:hypothetical protein
MLQNQQQQEGSKGRLMGGQCGNLPHVGSQDRKGRESTKYEEDEGCRGRQLNLVLDPWTSWIKCRMMNAERRMMKWPAHLHAPRPYPTLDSE